MKALLLGLGAFLALPATAADEIPPLGFAFSHYTGSGIYAVAGRSVQVYGIPVSFAVWKLEEHPFGIRVNVPLSLGFFDFKPTDVINQGLPEHIGTASIVPGVRFDVQATDRWLLGPFVEAGVAKDFEGGDLVYVGGAGLESEVRFLDSEVVGLLRNRLVAAQSRARDSDERESYYELRSSVELTGPLGFGFHGHRADLTGFAAAYVFYKPPEATVTRLLSEPSQEDTWVQWELGLSFGTDPQGKWWKIPLPRVGLSYRFGDGEEAVRIVFGSVF